MKKWKLQSIVKEIFIGAIILFVVSNMISYMRKPTLASNQLPRLDVQLLDGTQFVKHEAKPIVIHFWATWCPTCKLEAPNIERISKTYEVLSIAVNSGEDAKIKAYMAERKLTFKVVNDKEGKWAEQFNVEVYPTTFIYDAKGELKFSEVGYTTTAGLLARLKLIE